MKKSKIFILVLLILLTPYLVNITNAYAEDEESVIDVMSITYESHSIWKS